MSHIAKRKGVTYAVTDDYDYIIMLNHEGGK